MKFIRKQSKFFNKWYKYAGVNYFSDLVQLGLVDNFLDNMTPTVRIFLEGHKLESVFEAAKLVDTFEVNCKLRERMSKDTFFSHPYSSVDRDYHTIFFWCL